MSGVSISAVIKARNEARQIAACMESLRGFADEIIVVNDKSEDDTAAIAERLGARIIDAESQDGLINVLDRIGFEAASGEWILRIDADERLTPGLARAFIDAATSGHYAGVRFARKNIMFGAWARHGGWFRSEQLRFFRADAWDRGWSCIPHTQPAVTGAILVLPPREELATIHYEFDTVPQFVRRMLLGYATTEAKAWFRAGRRFSCLRFVLMPAKRFLGRYFLRQGVRDGLRGLILAGLLAAYDLCIEARVWDLQRGRGEQKGARRDGAEEQQEVTQD